MADHEGERRGTPRFSLPSMPSLPRLPMAVAAGLTGLVCGVSATVLVWSGEHGCDAVRGRPTCGGYGLLMLVLIGIICFVIGAALLRAFDVSDPGVTAFFGVTLPVIVILAFLLDHVFDTWMAFAMPVLVALCFIGSAYLARWLDAANPSPYSYDATPPADGDAHDAAPDRTEADEAPDDPGEAPDDTLVDDLPRYAPSDER